MRDGGNTDLPEQHFSSKAMILHTKFYIERWFRNEVYDECEPLIAHINHRIYIWLLQACRAEKRLIDQKSIAVRRQVPLNLVPAFTTIQSVFDELEVAGEIFC